MFVHAAQAMGYKVLVLDPDASGPAAQAADDIVVAAYDDMQAVAAFGKRVAAVTTEFRTSRRQRWKRSQQLYHTPCSGGGAHCAGSPPRSLFSDHGLPVGPFAVIEARRGPACGTANVVPGHPENGNARL